MCSTEPYTGGSHVSIYRPVLPEAYWWEEWWERRCATDFAAAYQQGRLVNQLNWYCQLAVLVSFWGHRINIPVCEEMIVPSRVHEQPIREIIRRLQGSVIEFGNDNAATLESQIDRRFCDFCEQVSSEATKGALVRALQRVRAWEEGASHAAKIRQSACVSLSDSLVKPFVEVLRQTLQTPLTGAECSAYSLGEMVDRGVRRPDVCSFLNRAEPNSEAEIGLARGPGSRLQVPGDQGFSSESESPKLFDPRDDNHPLVNFRPVAGSILPHRSWSNNLLSLARDLGSEGVLKPRRDPSSPMQFTFAQIRTASPEVSCMELATMVQELDRRVYAALCERESEWFHPVDETPSTEYKFGPVRGRLKEIARQLEQDERTVKGKARAGVFWVRQLGRYDYEFFFKNQAYEQRCRTPNATDAS